MDLVAVDWGTSSFRLWVVGKAGEVLASHRSELGMSRLERDDYGRVLEDSLAFLDVGLNVPVVICGMAGAAQGWVEAPYIAVPTPLESLGRRAVRIEGSKREVHVLPGVCQNTPPNVMRGEETQILGFLLSRPAYDGAIALPGTHTKWCRVSAGVLQEFETCMTGELFSLMSTGSVLRHSLEGDGWEDSVFLDAVVHAATYPEKMAALWFSLRADMLLRDLSKATARSRLSGWLIGLELSAAKRFWLEEPLRLIGEGALCRRYQAALGALNGRAQVVDATPVTIAGLRTAWEVLSRKPNLRRGRGFDSVSP